MARHKKLKPIDHKYLLNKKREKIRKAVDYTYLILIFSFILICGLNQSNAFIVGWGLIVMGIISIPVAIFHVYTIVMGWRTLFWYDDPDIVCHMSKDMIKRDKNADKIWRMIETLFLILLSIGLPIEGIIKLFGTHS